MPLPETYATYHGYVARAHPDLHFELLSRMVFEGRTMIEDIRVVGKHVGEEIAEEIRGHSGVKEVTIQEQAARGSVFRVTLETSPVQKLFLKMHLLQRYPIPFTGGVVKMLIVASPADVCAMYDGFKALAPETTISSIHSSAYVGPESRLTERQLQVFKLAYGAGYWEVPRRVTLSALAELLGVAKSTVAETMSAVENKLMREVREHSLAIP